jgi:hypothetical protein
LVSGLLVLITGTGRSGTSTLSGTFHHLGLYVPGPYLNANDSNPKGFFESKWSVKFHNRLNERAGINAYDSRPEAFELAQAAITTRAQSRLVEFLAQQAAVADQVVVKDPRSVWVQALWRQCAAAAGLDTRYVSMLRHPAESAGSRNTYYAAEDADSQRRYAILNVARWVNNSLISERETRGHPRAFVGYTDLLEDWRSVASRLRDELGLRYDSDLDLNRKHPVDDFIEPGLRRHEQSWADLPTPRDLREVADGVWQELIVLSQAGGRDDAASERLDELSSCYERVLADANAISQDIKHAAVLAAKAAGAAENQKQLDDQRAVRGPDSMLVGDVGGRDLLKVVGRRTKQKLRGKK